MAPPNLLELRGGGGGASPLPPLFFPQQISISAELGNPEVLLEVIRSKSNPFRPPEPSVPSLL
jgi:hypothetical protein